MRYPLLFALPFIGQETYFSVLFPIFQRTPVPNIVLVAFAYLVAFALALIPFLINWPSIRTTLRRYAIATPIAMGFWFLWSRYSSEQAKQDCMNDPNCGGYVDGPEFLIWFVAVQAAVLGAAAIAIAYAVHEGLQTDKHAGDKEKQTG